MRPLAMIVPTLCLTASVCVADGQFSLTDQKQKNAYALGYDFGKNLRSGEVELDPDLLIAAIKEGLAGAKPAMGEEERKAIHLQLREQVATVIRRHVEEEKVANLKESEAFLKTNKKKPGFTTLSDGLQYKVLSEGNGPHPKKSDIVKVHYRGTLANGVEFDNSHSRSDPTVVPVSGVIDGWTEALQRMKVGSKWRIAVPPALAYGAQRYGRIPANSALVFDIELLSIEKEATLRNQSSQQNKQ